MVSALGVTINPDASITTTTGTVYYTNSGGASPNFYASYDPTYGGAAIPFSGKFNTDNSGSVNVDLLLGNDIDIPRASATINLTPSAGNLVQQAFDETTQTTYLRLQNPNTTQDWATVLLRLNGTVLTQETVTDRGGNTFTFGYDGNGAVDVETIAQANTGSTAVYSFDTLNQQAWTTAETLFQYDQPVAAYVFNRDGTVQLNNYASTGQLDSDTLYTTNVGALETVYDIVGNQPYSAYQVQMNAALQTTTITQYERSGDVYVDAVDPATNLVKTDTHIRPNGGNTTSIYNDYLGNQSYSTIVSNYTAAGAAIDQTVYYRDQSTVIYKYDTRNGQVQEVDQFSGSGISQTYTDTTGTLPWNTLINSFNGQGVFQGETIYNKDGTVTFFSTGSVAAPVAPPNSSAGGSPGTHSTTPGPSGYYAPPPVIIVPPLHSPLLSPGPASTSFNTPGDPTIPPVTNDGIAPVVTNPFANGDPGAGAPVGAGSGGGIPVISLDVTSFDGISTTDPLIVNFHGNVQTTSGNTNNTIFDLTGTGVMQQVGWVTKGEGFLVSDPNLTPVTNATQWLASANDLTPFDTNGDGIIDSADAGFRSLDVWVPDAHGGAVKSLADLGIKAIDLNFVPEDVSDQGNTISKVFTIVNGNGTLGQGAEVNLSDVPKPTPSTSSMFYTPPPPPLIPTNHT